MATTYTLISSNVLSSSAASVTFSSIPATYTDLVLRISARSASAGTDAFFVQFNSDTATNYSSTQLYGDGSAAYSFRGSNTNALKKTYLNNNGNTANSFGSAEFYIPSYTASQNKPVSSIGIEETNATAASITATADLWRNTAAITSIFIRTDNNQNFLSGSSFYLYGISNA